MTLCLSLITWPSGRQQRLKMHVYGHEAGELHGVLFYFPTSASVKLLVCFMAGMGEKLAWGCHAAAFWLGALQLWGLMFPDPFVIPFTYSIFLFLYLFTYSYLFSFSKIDLFCFQARGHKRRPNLTCFAFILCYSIFCYGCVFDFVVLDLVF